MSRGAADNSGGQSKLADFGFPGVKARKNRFPLQATCMSCGRVRWLNWVVEGSHVCDGCKQSLAGGKNG